MVRYELNSGGKKFCNILRKLFKRYFQEKLHHYLGWNMGDHIGEERECAHHLLVCLHLQFFTERSSTRLSNHFFSGVYTGNISSLNCAQLIDRYIITTIFNSIFALKKPSTCSFIERRNIASVDSFTVIHTFVLARRHFIAQLSLPRSKSLVLGNLVERHRSVDFLRNSSSSADFLRISIERWNIASVDTSTEIHTFIPWN